MPPAVVGMRGSRTENGPDPTSIDRFPLPEARQVEKPSGKTLSGEKPHSSTGGGHAFGCVEGVRSSLVRFGGFRDFGGAARGAIFPSAPRPSELLLSQACRPIARERGGRGEGELLRRGCGALGTHEPRHRLHGRHLRLARVGGKLLPRARYHGHLPLRRLATAPLGGGAFGARARDPCVGVRGRVSALGVFDPGRKRRERAVVAPHEPEGNPRPGARFAGSLRSEA